MAGCKRPYHVLGDGGQGRAIKPPRCPQNIAGGSFAYREWVRQAGVPDGPTTIEASADYVRRHLDIVSSLGKCERKQALGRVVALLRNGLVTHSDCSGRLSFELVLLNLGIGLQEKTGALRSDWLAHWRACDISALCREVISKAGRLKPIHVFERLQDRLPAEALAYLDKIRLCEKDASDIRKIGLDAIGDYVRKNAESVLVQSRKAPNVFVTLA